MGTGPLLQRDHLCWGMTDPSLGLGILFPLLLLSSRNQSVPREARLKWKIRRGGLTLANFRFLLECWGPETRSTDHKDRALAADAGAEEWHCEAWRA